MAYSIQMSKCTLISFLILLLFTCSDDEQVTKSFVNVDERLWPYFERFEEVAADRGVKVDLNLSGIEGHLERFDQPNVAGKCQHPTPSENILVIDLPFFVNTENDLLKEFVIFHELGHCYLGREHREDSYQNGFCISIMRSGIDDCKDNYHQNTRSLYLDELFDPDSF